MSEPTRIDVDLQPSAIPSSGEAAPPGAEQRPGKERNASLWADAWRDLLRNAVFLISALVVLVVISMAAFPSLWTSVDPRACNIDFSKRPPGNGHIFGTSQFGCDLYASVIYGSRPSIQVAVWSTLGVVLAGGLTGIIAGYYGRWLDAIVSRIADTVLGLPFLLGALTLLSLLEVRSVWTIVFVLIVLGWPVVTRIMRASVIATKNMDYVQAARSLGASDVRIMFRHVLPNSLAPTIVVATILLGAYVSAEATLTFLGVGLRAPTVSWGVLITEGQRWALTPGKGFLLLVPVAFLVATVLSFILMGDAARDALDPKLR